MRVGSKRFPLDVWEFSRSFGNCPLGIVGSCVLSPFGFNLAPSIYAMWTMIYQLRDRNVKTSKMLLAKRDSCIA